MRLRRSINRTMPDGTVYWRWRLELNQEEAAEAERLGWKDGDELETVTRRGRMSIGRAGK